MPTVDIWGVLTGVKNVAAYVFSSRVGILVASAAFVLATLTTFYAWWSGIRLPVIDISSLEIDQGIIGNSGICDIILYCVHADYVLTFLNWVITFVNGFIPFVTTLIFSALVFKFSVFLKNAIGTDIRTAT